MPAVAVSVSDEPVQRGFVPDVTAIVTSGTGEDITEMVVPALVAVVVFKHAALDVTTHVIISPFEGATGV